MRSPEQALAELARTDARMVADARTAWEHVTQGKGFDGLSQWRLQNYLWLELHHLLPDQPARRLDLAASLATLLDSLALPRYAAMVRSEVTHGILRSNEPLNDSSRVVRRAMNSSGIEPPDTELLSWGIRPGPAELLAEQVVAETLELSLASGMLSRAARGWRDQQCDITVSVLTSPHQAFSGAVPYDEILQERLHEWVRGMGSPTRTAILSPLQNGLLLPVIPVSPAIVRRLLKPLDWLLHEVSDGITLTAAGYLPPRIVGRALDALGWRGEVLGNHVTEFAVREGDAYPVLLLRSAAQRLGFLRVRDNRLLLSRNGRDAVTDGRMLWNLVAGALIGREESALSTTWEIVCAVLVSGDETAENDLQDMVTATLREYSTPLENAQERGFMGSSTVDTGPIFHAVLRELRSLGLIEESGPLHERRVRAGSGVPELFRAALRYRVLHREMVATFPGS